MARIRALLDFNVKAPATAVNRGNAVYTGMNGNAAFTQPPVEMPVLRTEIDTVSEAIAAALDGGKRAVVVRNAQTAALCKSLRHLSSYVEANCKDDMTIFVSSGFQAASGTRTRVSPLSEFIRRIEAGNVSGEMVVFLAATRDAISYELRWAQMANGMPGQWTSRLVAKTRPPVTVGSLTPGSTYAFAVRVQTGDSYSDWSDAVTQVCT